MKIIVTLLACLGFMPAASAKVEHIEITGEPSKFASASELREQLAEQQALVKRLQDELEAYRAINKTQKQFFRNCKGDGNGGK